MGFRVSGAPTYLLHTPSGYYFRLRIPEDLQPLVGRGEFRYSLKCGALRIAKHRARCIASFVQTLFLKVRNSMAEWSQERITKVVRDYIKETLLNDEKCRAMPREPSGKTQTLDGKTFLEASDMKADEARSVLTVVNRWLQNQDHEAMEPIVKRIAQDLDTNSNEYRQLSRELLLAFRSVLGVRIKRSEGDYETLDEELIPILKKEPQTDTEQSQTIVKGVPASLVFTEVQGRYIEEVEKGDSWRDKTKHENLAIFELFVETMGDLPVDTISRQLMNEYKSKLMKLPPNMKKKKEYKGKTVQEILAMGALPKTLSVNTINKHLRRLSGLFNWAVHNGYMQVNPASEMQIKSSKRADQEREAYTQDDLRKLFESEEYTERSHRQSYGYWAPLIALYTGCRLEEICQLHLEDIRQEGGVWIFDINDKDEKRLKNRSSERFVPVHPKLIEIGLLKHCDMLRSRGEGRLFPELRQRRDGYGQTVSKWFQRYKERCGMGKGKTFHSFRHTFITHLKHKGVDPVMIHELDGHTIDSEFGRYGKRYSPEILLKEAIEKINYGLDLLESE